MNRFDRLHRMNMEGFAKAVVDIVNEMPYCANENCPFLSSDGFVCRSEDSNKHCPQAIMNYLSEEVDNMATPDNNGSVILAIMISIVAVAITALALLIK